MKKAKNTFIPAFGAAYALVSQKNRVHKDKKKDYKKGIRKHKAHIFYE